MPRPAALVLLTLGVFAASANAQAPAPGEAAKEMVGAWEISNAARDKVCPLTFNLDPAGAAYKLELDPTCGRVFPSLKNVATWAIGPNDSVQLFDSSAAVVLDFTEVEAHMFEAERKGEGLFFMRTQAAVRADTISPDKIFGEWALLQEFEKPLCKITLSNAAAGGGDSYRITVKPGCSAPIAAFGLSSWRIQDNELLLAGSAGTWRFSESDANVWERVPPSTDPLLLMR